MEPATRRFRTDDGLCLVADAYGDPSRPCVLLQHGGGQTRHSWGGSAGALAERGWYALTLDLRGHGDSDWAEDGDYSLARYARDTVSVARSLPHPPALVGASLGGIAGLLASDQGESRVLSALVLVDITPRMNVDGAKAILSFMGERMEDGFASLEEAADAIARYLPHRPRPRDLSGLQKNLRLGEDHRYRWHWDPEFVLGRRRPGPRFDEERLLAAARNLDVPTLLVRGRLSELVDEESAREFLDMVPHAEYRDVSGAGHMVAGDRNDVFTAAVAEFLDGRASPDLAP